MPKQLKVALNEAVDTKPQTKEGLLWIDKFLEDNGGKIMNMIRHQSSLRNHQIDMSKVELSLFVDDSDAQWNGVWAFIVSGQDSIFQSTYRYYFEHNKENMTLCRVYGIGLTIGAQATGPVSRYLEKLEENDILPADATDTQKEMFAGIWKLNYAKSGSVAECFSSSKDIYPNRDQDSYLIIDSDLTCKFISSFSGVYRKPWTGMVHMVKVPKLGEVFVLTDSSMKKPIATFGNSRIISLVDTGKLVIWHNEERYELHRPLMTPSFPVDKIELNNLLDQRAGSIQIIESRANQ